MKRIWLFTILLLWSGSCFPNLGCTAPTQPWAETNLQMGHNKYDEVVDKLAELTYQANLNEADRVVRECDDADSRSEALVKMSDEYHKISYLQIQGGRASECLRNCYQWVHGQRGILNILFEDILKAKERSDEKDKIPTSQPVDQSDAI